MIFSSSSTSFHHEFSPPKTTAPLVEAAWINAAISVAVINSLRTREASISAKSCCSWINQRSFTKAPGISMAFFGGDLVFGDVVDGKKLNMKKKHRHV